jgi:Cu/Ag efflux protein CusF
MARPGNFPLALYRGDTYAWQFMLYTDSSATPAPADLTGVTAKAEIRDRPGGTLLTTMAVTITLPNIIVVKLKTANWTGLATKAAAWDLQLTYTDADASVVTIIAGAVTITADVTDTVSMPAMTAVEQRRTILAKLSEPLAVSRG